jgi:hypothetical protein
MRLQTRVRRGAITILVALGALAVVAVGSPAVAAPMSLSTTTASTIDLSNQAGDSLLPGSPAVVAPASDGSSTEPLFVSLFVPGNDIYLNVSYTVDAPGLDNAHPFSQTQSFPGSAIINYDHVIEFDVPLRTGQQDITATLKSSNQATVVVTGSITGLTATVSSTLQFEDAAGDWHDALDGSTVDLLAGAAVNIRQRVAFYGPGLTFTTSSWSVTGSNADHVASCGPRTFSSGGLGYCTVSGTEFTDDPAQTWQATVSGSTLLGSPVSSNNFATQTVGGTFTLSKTSGAPGSSLVITGAGFVGAPTFVATLEGVRMTGTSTARTQTESTLRTIVSASATPGKTRVIVILNGYAVAILPFTVLEASIAKPTLAETGFDPSIYLDLALAAIVAGLALAAVGRFRMLRG